MSTVGGGLVAPRPQPRSPTATRLGQASSVRVSAPVPDDAAIAASLDVLGAGDPTVLAAALAHEVANALTPILARGRPTPEMSREHAKRAQRACEAVLSIASPDAAPSRFYVEHPVSMDEAASCDVMDAWANAWAEVASRGEGGASLDVHATRDSRVAVPIAIVERLLANLAANAVRAVASRSSLSQIRLVCRGGVVDGVLDDPSVTWVHRAEPPAEMGRPWVVIEIVDDGPGFPLGFELLAFRPRWRDADGRGEGAGRSTGAPGYGLGLAVCHALAVRWGVCIGVVRGAGLGHEGRGARVVLAMPSHIMS